MDTQTETCCQPIGYTSVPNPADDKAKNPCDHSRVTKRPAVLDGERLRIARERAGIRSDRELGDMIGVGRVQISRWVTGERGG